MVPPREIWGRLQRLRDAIISECALIFQNADRYYFSGTLMGEFIFLGKDEISLYCRKACERAERETPLPLKYGRMNSLKKIGDLKTIGIEFDVLPISIFFYLKKLFPNSDFIDISGIIRNLRSVKSNYEIGKIRKAAHIVDLGMKHASEIIHPGMCEIDLAASIEKKMREEGHQGLVRSRSFGYELFYGHILSGKNGAMPSFLDSPTGGQGLSPAMPQGAGYKKIRKNEPVLVDYVGVWEGYIADESRIFKCGKLSPRLQDALDASCTIQRWIEKSLSAEEIPQDIFCGAQEIAKIAGFEKNFLGLKEKIKFVGHGVGLELDELPVLASGCIMPLKNRMTIASEPKFIFNSGVVGVEDTFLVGKKKAERLTRFPQ
jgi:Xaa-Pro dipeptidase